MDATAIALLDIFEKKMRLEIPMFQRQYVWNREHQWEPLWEDISLKFREFIEGRSDAPAHFLGAMVLDQKQTQTGRVERRNVIDGQQRLTTLQLFLAAFRDFCQSEDLDDFSEECGKYVLNTGRMAEPEIEQFKVWPTLSDRSQFTSVVTAGSLAKLEEHFPATRAKFARRANPRPLMVEAYLFFYDQLSRFFNGTDEEPAFAADVPLVERVEECFEALKTALKIVAIDLDEDDDAQVIFETLNARGEPLLPADLLRNYIFLRAARNGEPQEALYKKYWAEFDEPHWREEIGHGRATRPRSDIFMQHYLSSKRAREIPIKHLFSEYKYWVDHTKPFSNIEGELGSLSKQREDYIRISVVREGDSLARLAHFMDVFDTSTAYPPLLAMLDKNANDQEMLRVSRIIESYLVRRAICASQARAYNTIFINLTKVIRQNGATSAGVLEYFSSLRASRDEWISDAEFSQAWMEKSIYGSLINRRLAYVLARLNETYQTSKSEVIKFESPVTIEHLMPQNWIDHWPLQDGSKGFSEAWMDDNLTPVATASKHRHSLLHTFGNLTLVSGSLNSSLQNGPWLEKRREILTHSLLPMNGNLYQYQTWDEGTIERRGRELLERALKIWPRNPDAFS